MPEISRFFGIIIRLFYEDHSPPHIHVEYQGNKALFDFQGNILRGSLESRTAIRLVRDWIEIHFNELGEDWELARTGKPIRSIPPLD